MTTDQVLNKKEIVELCDVRAGELVIHASLPDRYEAWIESHEQAIRAEIAKRYTPGGFLRRLSKIHLLQLQAATTISLDLETTALTPYSETVNITKQTKFGELTRDAYYAAHPGVSISDTSPRIRVTGLYLPLTGQRLLFDLDHMAPADIQLLIDTVLDGKILIGHNIFGFDLYWLFHRSSKRPSNVLDTLMLVRQCKPEILSYANFDAATGSIERLAEIAEDKDVALTASASLEAISIQLGLPRPAKCWQKPQNWALSELSADHLTYVDSDITSPCRILKHIFGTVDGRAIVNHIKADYPWYRDYHKAAMRTTEAMVRGIPFDNERAVELKAELAIEIAAKAEAMKQWPEFAGDEIFKELANPAKGTTKRVREAIHGLAKAADVVLPLTDKSKKLMETYEEEKAKLGNENLAIPEKINISLSKKALMFANIDLPVLNDYVSLAEVKKLHELIEDWQFFARVDGKLHPLYAWTTAAGRASTSEPNPLGAPRDKRIRGLLCHTPGYKVPVVDYNAVELRIAVVNAAKAIEEIEKYLTECNPTTFYDIFSGTQAWFLTTCYASQFKGPTQYPGDTPPDGTTKDEWQKEKAAHIITYFASRVLGKNVQSLASVFQFGVDPHLATALTMLRIQGEIDFTGSATEYLASFSAEEQEQLKGGKFRVTLRHDAGSTSPLWRYQLRPQMEA